MKGIKGSFRALTVIVALAAALLLAACGMGLPQDLLTAPFGQVTGSEGLQPESTPKVDERLSAARAHLEKARRLNMDGDYELAIAELTNVISLAPGTPEEEEAIFRLGESHLGRRRYYDAAGMLEGFVQRFPNGPFTAKGRFYLAAANLGIGARDAALSNYELAAKMEPSLQGYASFQIADIYEKAGDYTRSIERLVAVTKDAESTVREQAMERLGNVYSKLGRFKEAVSWYEAALKEVGDSRYEEPRLRFQLGRAYVNAGNPAGGTAQFVSVLRAFPASKEAPSARLELIRLAGRSNPAVAEYDAAAASYTQGNSAADARFRQGLLAYERDDFAMAASIWRSTADDPSSLKAALPKLLMWAGKAEFRRGNNEEAGRLWQKALEINPDDYYSLRAEEWLNQLSGKRIAVPFNASPVQTDAQKKELAEWIRGLPYPAIVASDVKQMNRSIMDDPAAQRAKLLLELGMRNEGAREIHRLLDRFAQDPLAVYQAGNLALEHRLYEPAMAAGARLQSLAGDNQAKLPELATRLLLPLAYGDILAEEAKRAGVDPYLMLALMKQESVFNKDVFSYVGAAGLTQVMPATGREIAASLAVPSFKTEDLLQPTISIRFGSWYLGQQLERFKGDPFFALAAYNGGAGNVAYWRKGAAAYDDDLFVEKITFWETQTYVKKVYTYYRLYQRHYSK